MARYAKNTSVSSERSRVEIERILSRYGAGRFAYMTQEQAAMVVFEMAGKRIRFVLPLPNPNDRKFTHTGRREKQRFPEDARAVWEQACRSSWRALVLSIKAKLETVESGIATFEDEFLSYILLPGNKTVGEKMLPDLNRIYETGKVPALEFKS